MRRSQARGVALRRPYRTQAAERLARLTTAVVLATLWLARPAEAHHGPASATGLGAGANISTRRATANTQLTSSLQVARVEELGAAGEVYTLGLGAEVAWASRWSSGAELPIVAIVPGSGDATTGLHNLRLTTKWLFTEPTPVGAPWALEWFVGLPTRTAVLGLDPGPVWDFGAQSQYSLRSRVALLQVRGGLAGDVRRAGTALELTYAAQYVYLLTRTWATALSALGATRVATWCRDPGGTSVCSEGRASEVPTKTLATALSAELAVEASLWDDGGARASGRVPLTSRRDSEWATMLLLVFGF